MLYIISITFSHYKCRAGRSCNITMCYATHFHLHASAGRMLPLYFCGENVW